MKELEFFGGGWLLLLLLLVTLGVEDPANGEQES